MELNELIEKGEVFYSQEQSSDYGANYITGEDYVQWIAQVAILMEDVPLPNVMDKQLNDALENAVGNGKEYLEKIMGILKAVDNNNGE